MMYLFRSGIFTLGITALFLSILPSIVLSEDVGESSIGTLDNPPATDGSIAPVTTIPLDTPPSDSTDGGQAATDSGEGEDLYYKFNGVKTPRSPPSKLKGSFETDLFTGSASYLYAFDVPKGTNDLTPNVFLRYNSQGAKGRAGFSGLGWDIGQPNSRQKYAIM